MVKWEYRQEIFQGVELMNEWGAEGWELAGFFGKDGAFMLLKRQVAGRSGHAHAPAPVATPSPAAARPQPNRPSTGSRPRPGTRSPGPNKGKEMI